MPLELLVVEVALPAHASARTLLLDQIRRLKPHTEQ
jgi:hypothetical protein